MNIVHDISKKSLTEIRDIDLDKRGKKIKVRETNYISLLQHTRKVPSCIFQILPISNREYVNGDSRAINVKENVLNSIAKKAIIPLTQENILLDGRMADNSVILDVDTMPNVDDYFQQISSERQNLLTDKIEVEKVIEKVNNSTKLLNELSLKETEEQKKYEEKHRRLNEINQKIVDAIKTQMDTLIANRKKYQSMLEENSKIEMENQQKIVQFQSRIGKVEQNNLNIENDIARQQEILNALMNFENNDNIIGFSPIENNNDIVTRRVA